ncbi:MAG: flagellar biosynthesis protein FlgJ [Desulfuromonadaceae bacterium GWB2_53_15]|nr:MAG: flagellar biosynthesis protein FlgJ [Desulfuromonadaceae bacterium GWB2_53_15]
MEIGIPQDIPAAGDGAADKARQLQKLGNAAAGLSEKQRLQAKKVSQDFEALFVGMMLKSMRSTVGEDKMTGGGHGEETFRSLLDQEYATAAVKRGGIGLAKQIEKEIIRQESRTSGRVVDRRE